MRRCAEHAAAVTAMRRPQHAAALIVCLLLASLVATLAALATQSATMEQQSVAAARFQLQALAAAEYCATQLTNGLIALAPPALPPDIADLPVPGMPAGRMRCRLLEIGADAAIAARSAGAQRGTHYTVLASGSAPRNARATIEQGVLLVRDAAGTLQLATRVYWLRLD
jgi:hypothetical protein